jgi:dTDP-4-amino-4,6-dideoxygalactose transaminase
MTTGLDIIPLAKPVIGEAEEQAVLEVLRSGQLSLGPHVPAFERAFAERVGARHASAVSSGTTGLHLALRAVGVSAGDEVVTSPFSFVASANAPLFEGARPVFADIDPVTLNIDPDAAAAAITGRTTALLPVHIFGYPADVGALERHGLPIVEDACEALAGLVAERGLMLPCDDAGGNVRGWFVFVVQLPEGVDRDATVGALRELGVQSKPYLPAIHLMSFYRERFGHRPGEFPVCERVAAASLALPFFPQMRKGQVARVADALAQVIAA